MRRMYVTLWGVGLLYAVASLGCGQRDVIAEKELAIEELRTQNSELRSELEGNQSSKYTLEQSVKTLAEERDSALAESQSLKTELRTAEQEVDRLTKKNVQLASRSVELERDYDQLKLTLKSVQQEAARLAEELSDYRLEVGDNESRSTQLDREVQNLRAQNQELSGELSSLEEELRKQKVMIDVLKKSGSTTAPSDNASVLALQQKVEELRQSVNAHQEERVALHKQIEGLKALVPEESVGEIMTSAKDFFYEDDPSGLVAEVGNVFKTRFGAMTSREARWDGVDIALAVAGVLFLIALIWLAWTPLRWKKRRAMRDEIADLRERLNQREVEPDDETARAKRPRQRQGGSGVVRRSGQFSPILGTDVAESENAGLERSPVSEVAVADETIGDVELPAFEPTEGASEVATDRPASGAARGSQVIGAPTWDDAADDGDDEFENTQILPNVSEMDLLSPSSAPLSRDPLAPQGAVDDDGDEEFEHTQVIPSLDEMDAEPTIQIGGPIAESSPKESPKTKAPSSQQLMDELEDLIGKKVDELIQ